MGLMRYQNLPCVQMCNPNAQFNGINKSAPPPPPLHPTVSLWSKPGKVLQFSFATIFFTKKIKILNVSIIDRSTLIRYWKVVIGKF